MRVVCTKAGIDARCYMCRHREPHEENSGCNDESCTFQGYEKITSIACVPPDQVWRFAGGCAEAKPLKPIGDDDGK